MGRVGYWTSARPVLEDRFPEPIRAPVSTAREYPSSLGEAAECSPRHGRGFSGRATDQAPEGRQRCSAPRPPTQPLAHWDPGLGPVPGLATSWTWATCRPLQG